MTAAVLESFRSTILIAAVLSAAISAQETRPFTLPAKQLAPLETAAQLMARSGWGAEAEDLVAIMKVLGYSEAQADKLVKTCKTDAKGKKRAPVPAIVKSLKATAQQIAKAVPENAAESRAAEAILAIDGSIEALHQRLGEEKTAAGWRTPEQARAAARRSEIQAALAKARRIQPEVVVAEDTEAMFHELHGTPCTKVSSNGVTIWSRWSPEKLRRVLVESLRAAALSNYLLQGELAIPKFNEKFLLLDARKDYDRSIEIAVSRGWLAEKDAVEARRITAFYADRVEIGRYLVTFDQTEAAAEAGTLFSCSHYMGGGGLCPPLRVGHLNWVCLSYLGTQMPGVSWTEPEGEKRQRRTASGADPADDRKRVLRLSEAGLAGSRSWLAYLVAHGEDPPFANSIVDQEGKIEGNDRLKCTFVVEFLQEHDELMPLVNKTVLGTHASFELAWGGSFASFEARWRKWLLGTPASIVERLDPPKPRIFTPGEVDVLARLNEHRRRCFKGSICSDLAPDDGGTWPAELIDPYLEVTLDDPLTAGARKHAHYLGNHPEQLAAWPDAHEEWPDRPDFTAEGSWAGGHSVIAPGVRSPDEALNGWLGTFYHRLPLIHPGLMRIGWALEKDVAVLDSGSLARPLSGPWHVVWPYDGMTDVPTHFAPELPNPVPGVDQATFGYPITLQVGEYRGDASPPAIEIKLRVGSEKGPEVECHLSTPAAPSNPDLKISDAWCLIPKAPLKTATTYAVSAKWSNGRSIAWTFKTGK